MQSVGVLGRLAIPYMVTGGLAVIYYGEPRTTHDLDFVVLISPADVARMKAALEPEFSVDDESIRAALREGSMFNAIHEETGFKVDFWMLKADLYSRTCFARRVQVQVLGVVMFLPTAEDVIIGKLEWYKLSDIDKHYRDACGVAAIQKGKLDTAYIARWCQARGLLELWEQVQQEADV